MEAANVNLIIVFGAALLLIIAAIFLKKIVTFILVLLVLAGLLYYVFIASNIIKPKTEHTKYSIEYIKEQSYKNMKTKKDSLRYYYVIIPIYKDITNQYTETERLRLEKDPIEYYKILNKSLKKNKKQILKNLSKAKEKDLFYNFSKNLNKKYFTNLNLNQ